MLNERKMIMVLLCSTLKVKPTKYSELTNGGLGASLEVVHLSIHVNALSKLLHALGKSRTIMHAVAHCHMWRANVHMI